MPSIGPLEIVIVLFIALVVFGPKKLPELGQGLGTGMREFKRSVTGTGELPAAPATEPPAAPSPQQEEVR